MFYLKRIISEENENRRTILLNFISFQINYKIEEMDCSAKYYENECPFCRNYTYLSYLLCNNCLRRGCITHSIQCKCLPTNFTLAYRFMDNVCLFLRLAGIIYI